MIDRHSWGTIGIKILEEILGLLRITEDYASDGNRTIEPALKEMLIAPTIAVYKETA